MDLTGAGQIWPHLAPSGLAPRLPAGADL